MTQQQPAQSKRYIADETENGQPMVLDTFYEPARVLTGCRTTEDAERIAQERNEGWEASRAV